MPRTFFALLALCACAALPTNASASAPGPDGYFQTGVAAHKTAGEHDYTIMHEVKQLPALRTPQAFIEADTPKRFVINTLKDIPCASFSSFLRAGLQREGTAAADVNRLAQVCPSGVVKQRSRIVIAYDPSTTVTSLSVEKLGTVSISGRPAMLRIWKIWLGAGAAAGDRAALSSRR